MYLIYLYVQVVINSCVTDVNSALILCVTGFEKG